MLWVIPCRFDPIVYDCVEAIRKHFPDDQILIVDSNSPDQSYLDELDVDYIELGNNHYATGAWERALNYPADRYALIHDSLIIQSAWQPSDFQTVRWFAETEPPADQAPFINRHLDRMDIRPAPYLGIFGPMLFCTRPVLEDFAAVGLFDAKPTDKVEASCMERLTGIVAQHLGYNALDSLQGQMIAFWGNYPEDRAAKVYKDRP